MKDEMILLTFNEDGTVASITTGSSLKGTDDLVNLGSLTPKFNGALTFRLSYKGIEFGMLSLYMQVVINYVIVL